MSEVFSEGLSWILPLKRTLSTFQSNHLLGESILPFKQVQNSGAGDRKHAWIQLLIKSFEDMTSQQLFETKDSVMKSTMFGSSSELSRERVLAQEVA